MIKFKHLLDEDRIHEIAWLAAENWLPSQIDKEEAINRASPDMKAADIYAVPSQIYGEGLIKAYQAVKRELHNAFEYIEIRQQDVPLITKLAFLAASQWAKSVEAKAPWGSRKITPDFFGQRIATAYKTAVLAANDQLRRSSLNDAG